MYFSCVLFWDTRPPKGPQQQQGSKEKTGPKNPMGVPDTFKHLDLTWKPMLKVGFLHFHYYFDIQIAWVEFRPGPKVIKLFSYSTQLSMKFILLIIVKMTTIVSILAFISMLKTLWEAESKKLLLFVGILVLRAVEISCSVELSMKMKKVLYQGLAQGYRTFFHEQANCFIHFHYYFVIQIAFYIK